MGDDKGYFYMAYCHKAQVSMQSCVLTKVRLPELNVDKNHQTNIDRVYILNKNGRYIVQTEFKFEAVYFENVNNIPNANIQLPADITKFQTLNFSDVFVNKYTYQEDESGYGASLYIVK